LPHCDQYYGGLLCDEFGIRALRLILAQAVEGWDCQVTLAEGKGCVLERAWLRSVFKFPSASFQFFDQLLDHLKQIGVSDATGNVAPALSVSAKLSSSFHGNLAIREKREYGVCPLD
jgi:hypothetical protein